jgi:formylglycine-generating enzyme required for sulfatase activity
MSPRSRSLALAPVPLVLAVAVAVAGAKKPASGCPAEMAPIPGTNACIDRWEAALAGGSPGAPDGKGTTARAVSRRGQAPAVNVSQLQADVACRRAGKRLCSLAEWQAACRGGGARKYAYGDAYEKGRCHDRTMAAERHTTGPLPTGSVPRCRTPEGGEGGGVYDLSGNVWEWLAAEGAAQVATFIGGSLYTDDAEDVQSCVPEEGMAQPLTQRTAAIGFRCCASQSSR